jgi:IclR family mhp operon transcriptional activator
MVTLPDISVSPTPPGMAIVADIGLKHTIDMTAKIGWPSDIQILEKHWMRIVESTRAISPYSLYQGKIDRRINVFASATGLACLTEMAIADVRKMYEDETQGPRFGAVRFGITWEALVARLEESREQGYSVRLLQYTGETVENDNLHAIARPMKKNGMVCGAVSILWPKILMPPADFAAAYLDELIETVAAIEDTLDAHHQSSQ